MAKRKEINRKEFILVTIAIALSTALVGHFQDLFDSFAENLPELLRPAAWAFSIIIWIIIVMFIMYFFLWIFGYKVEEENGG